MLYREIERVLRENEAYAKMLEEYDRTGELPTEKIRRSFTLKRMTLAKLKSLSARKGKSMSGLLDELVEKEQV